jgi:cell division protein FtsN
MTQDYKARKNPRARRPRSGAGFFWFATGVVVGAFGVGLAWTLQDADQAGPPSEQASAAADQRPSAKPRFDFYNILPEMEVLVPDEELSGKPPPIPPKPQPVQKPAPEPAKPAEEKTASTQTPAAGGSAFLLQVASYRTVADAERLKARLALLGMQAQIQQVTVNGKDTYHRVRTGPYKGKESVNEARALLTRNGLESIAIKLK